MKTGKRCWLLLLPLAALLAGFLAWMYHPRSLTTSLRALGGDIGVRIITTELRVEANIMPRNTASRRAAAKAGFVEEGLSRKYLKINGVWEDHIHMVRLNGEN